MAPAAGLPEPVDLQALCALARLRVPVGLQDELRHRLHAVLQSFASLGAIDTREIDLGAIEAGAISPTGAPQAGDPLAAPPAATPFGNPSATGLRPDRAEPPMPTELLLANAPRVLLNAFLVPRVVEG
jgi:Asp-tRNA(Asn)/Glu-tRNA(Gln) amidotransferase C subunit